MEIIRKWRRDITVFVTQSIMASGDHTFKYNAQGQIIER